LNADLFIDYELIPKDILHDVIKVHDMNEDWKQCRILFYNIEAGYSILKWYSSDEYKEYHDGQFNRKRINMIYRHYSSDLRQYKRKLKIVEQGIMPFKDYFKINIIRGYNE
jgi:hypothetical protein